MAKFRVADNLAEKVAAMVRPEVDRLAEKVQAEAKAGAPPVKIWNTQRDVRVRPTHVEVDYQAVPGNLRFRLRSHPWDMGIGREPDSEWKPRAVGPYVYFDRPREEVYGAYLNWVSCRCYLTFDQEGISRLIRRSPAYVHGKKATARVWVTGPGVIQAELGDVYPGDFVAEGTFFMRKAAMRAAAWHRSTRR